MARILVVDEHALFRLGIVRVLAEQFRTSVIEEAGTEAEYLQALSASHWDLIILDISARDYNGLQLLTDTKKQNPQQPVLALGSYPEEQYAKAALERGAAAYLYKGADGGRLVKAVTAILSAGTEK